MTKLGGQMYIGKEEIKEVKELDKKTPLGDKVYEVTFVSELDNIHKDMDKVKEIQDKLLDEKNKTTDEEEIKSIGSKLDNLNKEYENLTALQTPDKQIERKIYASQRVLDKCQSEQPDEEFYYKRKLAIVREILMILAEWCTEKVEFIPILQWTEQSFRDNEQRAIGKAFGKDIADVNMLDYHYAITESGTN